jgi:hypothetical protein
MKRIVFLFLTVFIAACTPKTFEKATRIPSKVDELSTKTEIEAYIRACDTNYKNYALKKLQDFHRSHYNDSINGVLADRLQIHTLFEKADFDNNGYTDLLAIGCNDFDLKQNHKSCNFFPIVVMNFGANSTKIIPIKLDHITAFVPFVHYEDNQPFLMVFQKKYDYFKKKYSQRKFQLTYLYDDFIEYNRHPTSKRITQIQIMSLGCFGDCPMYKLDLCRTGVSTFNAYLHNTSDAATSEPILMEGVYTTTLTSHTFNEIEKLINYCAVTHLKNFYSVDYTCAATAYLKVTYSDGEVKKIVDYGRFGTYSLKTLYSQLEALRFNQKWKKVKGEANLDLADDRSYQD